MKFTKPPKLKPGDKVAILSPSAGVPHLFPHVYELGLKRLEEEFNLVPVEFPTARKSPQYLEKNPLARADDLHAAFTDPSIKAVIATIGGNDQIRILPHLDPKIFKANPKPFFGYSDNTNLHLFLWNLGIISYYGANLMNQFGMQGKMHEFTVASIKKALFEPSIGEIHSAPQWTDYDLDWSDPQNLTKTRPMQPGEGWQWHNRPQGIIKGKLWGGCLEILDLHLAVRHYLPTPKKLAGCILYLETCEEMPPDGFVYRFLAALAERGILQKFKAILFAIPKSQFCGRLPPEGSTQYRLNQQTAVKKALKDYDLDIPVVFNLNFGHTDPQAIIPNGGVAILDGLKKSIHIN